MMNAENGCAYLGGGHVIPLNLVNIVTGLGLGIMSIDFFLARDLVIGLSLTLESSDLFYIESS